MGYAPGPLASLWRVPVPIHAYTRPPALRRVWRDSGGGIQGCEFAPAVAGKVAQTIKANPFRIGSILCPKERHTEAHRKGKA